MYAACKRFEDLGVEFRKKPEEGNMKGLAFILDPGGYFGFLIFVCVASIASVIHNCFLFCGWFVEFLTHSLTD